MFMFMFNTLANQIPNSTNPFSFFPLFIEYTSLKNIVPRMSKNKHKKTHSNEQVLYPTVSKRRDYFSSLAK
ncbi:hypothetical protein AB4400_28410, partial [Vibrio sp. 10N.261.48.A2]